MAQMPLKWLKLLPPFGPLLNLKNLPRAGAVRQIGGLGGDAAATRARREPRPAPVRVRLAVLPVNSLRAAQE